MKCTKCGREIPEGSKFCQYCGNRISTEATTAKTSNLSTGEITIAAVLGGIGIIFAIISIAAKETGVRWVCAILACIVIGTLANAIHDAIKNSRTPSNISELFMQGIKQSTKESGFAQKMEESANRRDTLFKGQRPDDPDYGYSASNPIMTSTIAQSDEYLKHLRTPDGKPFTWRRTGSRALRELHGVEDVMVDTYQLYLNGEEYKTIFVCPYGHGSSYIPQGMRHTLNTKAQIDEAFTALKKSAADYQDPPKGSRAYYSMRDPIETSIMIRCYECGRTAPIAIYEGEEDIIESYQALAKQFQDLGHEAKIRCACDECASKFLVSVMNPWEKHNFVFSFLANGADRSVISYPRARGYDETAYQVALSFLNGATTVKELSDETNTSLPAAKYIDYVRKIIIFGV